MNAPTGTYFRKTRARSGDTFTVEARREPVPVGNHANGPDLVTTVTIDLPGAASAARAVAAELNGVTYGRVYPAIRFRRMNLNGVRIVHTFWTVGRQA